MHASMYPRAFGNQQQVIGHECCIVWAAKCVVCRGGGDHHLATTPHPHPIVSLHDNAMYSELVYTYNASVIGRLLTPPSHTLCCVAPFCL